MKNTLFVGGITIASALSSQAAVITATNFSTAPIGIVNQGNRAHSLSTTVANTYFVEITGETGQAIDQWVADTNILVYDAGSDTYGGAATQTNRRGTLQIMNDAKGTTGFVDVTMNYTLGAGDSVTLELYAWNSGQTSAGLSWGGPDATSWNDTTVGDAATLLDITYTTGTSLSESVDLGTGYDYYMWRVGRSAGNTVQGDADQTTFSGLNVVVVPEPSSTALLGLGGLALILRRRK